MTHTYNRSVGGECQGPKAIEIQENKRLETVSKLHLQLVSILYVLPAQ